MYKKLLQWLCDKLIAKVYGFNPANAKAAPENVRYIPEPELRGSVKAWPDETIDKTTIELVASIANEP